MADHIGSDPPETSPSSPSYSNYNIQEFSLRGFLLTNHGLLPRRKAPTFYPSTASSSASPTSFSPNPEPANNNPPGLGSDKEQGEQSTPSATAAPGPSPLDHSLNTPNTPNIIPKSPSPTLGESAGSSSSSPSVDSPPLQPVKITPTSSSDEESGEERRASTVSSLPDQTTTPSEASSSEQALTSDPSSSNLVPATRLLQEFMEADELEPTMAQTAAASQISALSSSSSLLMEEEEKEEEEKEEEQEDNREGNDEVEEGDDGDDVEGEDVDSDENGVEKDEEESDDDIDVEEVMGENGDDVEEVRAVVMEEENDDGDDDDDVVEVVEVEDSEEVEDDEEEAIRLSLTTHSAVNNPDELYTSPSLTNNSISNTLVDVNASANASTLNEPTHHDQSTLPVSALASESASIFASTPITLGVREAVTVIIAVAMAQAAAMATVMAMIMENATPENTLIPAPVTTITTMPASTPTPTTITSTAATSALVLASAPTIPVAASPAPAPTTTCIVCATTTTTPAISPVPPITVANTPVSAAASATTVTMPLRSALKRANHNIDRPGPRPMKTVSWGPVTVLGPSSLNKRPIARTRGFARRLPFLFCSRAQASAECHAWINDDGNEDDGNTIHDRRQQGSRKVISRSRSKSGMPKTKDYQSSSSSAFSRSLLSEGKKRYRSSKYCPDDAICVSLRDVIVLGYIHVAPLSPPVEKVTQSPSRKRRWGESPTIISSSSSSGERPTAAAAERSSTSSNNYQASSIVAYPISATPFVPNRSLQRATWEHPLLNGYSLSRTMSFVQSSSYVERRWPYAETSVSRCYPSASSHRAHAQIEHSSVESALHLPPLAKKRSSKSVIAPTFRFQRAESNVEDLYDLALQEPSPLQRWINYAQLGYTVLATISQSVSWTCQRTINMSPAAWFYHRFLRDRFGFEEYYVDRADDGVVEEDYCTVGSWKKKVADDDPRKHRGSRTGRGIGETDTSASHIRVFGKGAHIQQQKKFEQSNHYEHQVEFRRTHHFGDWKSKLLGITRLLLRIAQLIPSFKKRQQEEWLDDEDGFSFSYDDDSYDDEDDQKLIEKEGDDDKVMTAIESILVQEDEAMVRPKEEQEDPLARTLLQVEQVLLEAKALVHI
ncbi:hypothetical protein BGZ95_008545 [Linnemannia exigua]|uniref:Uncharacterized protein n=1 Tax=Linnemannia exigua TaxID=604196 RepID=A0AAD4H6B4_9FUNG|nr:hypothetical protein BGZ95_008545 [Linnemannia exigua]